MDVTEGVGERELRTRIKRSFFFQPKRYIRKGNDKLRPLTRGRHSTVRSSSGPAEGYAVKKQKTKNKVGEWVNRLATTARLFSVIITPLQFHPSDLWENREFWGVWTRNLIFTHTSNGWRAIPATNTRREAHDWDLNFKRSLVFFLVFFNCECGSCGL